MSGREKSSAVTRPKGAPKRPSSAHPKLRSSTKSQHTSQQYVNPNNFIVDSGNNNNYGYNYTNTSSNNNNYYTGNNGIGSSNNGTNMVGNGLLSRERQVNLVSPRLASQEEMTSLMALDRSIRVLI